MNVCECAANLGEPVRAIASAERAVSEIERLTDTWPAVREYHSDLGGALSNLAWQLSEQERDLERAEKLAQRAIAEQRRSLETGGVNNFLMKHYSILAQIQWQLDRLSEARTTCDAGLQVVEQLEQKNPEDPDIAFNRGRFQQILGLVQQREQKANMSPAPVVERRKP
jgi:tetratricopeptide (TPR) repeat protein